IARLRLGEEERAAECYRAALAIARAAGDLRHQAFCLQNLGVHAHWRSDFAVALRCFQEAVAAFKKLGQRGRLAWLALDLASLYLASMELEGGDAAAARSLLGELGDDGGAAPRLSPATRARAALVGGELLLSRGEPQQARRPLLDATDAFHRLGELDGEWRAH